MLLQNTDPEKAKAHQQKLLSSTLKVVLSTSDRKEAAAVEIDEQVYELEKSTSVCYILILRHDSQGNQPSNNPVRSL